MLWSGVGTSVTVVVLGTTVLGGSRSPVSRNRCRSGVGVQLRTVFLLSAIVVLFLDALLYSGAFTQAAYAQLVAAGDYVVSLISGVIDSVKPAPDA
jgi:hypothetical protein